MARFSHIKGCCVANNSHTLRMAVEGRRTISGQTVEV